MYKYYLFDLDGTLLDTLDDLADSVNAALTAYGLPKRERKEIRAFLGNGMINLLTRAVGDRTDLFDDVFAYFKKHYTAHCADKTKLYDGMEETLRQLKLRGARCAVVSNKADFAVQMLAKEYFGDLIERSIGENEAIGIMRKPAPDTVLEVMKEFGAKKEETVYIGDSEVDIQTAKNAGVDCVCVTWGFRDREYLIENGASVLVDNPKEILSL